MTDYVTKDSGERAEYDSGMVRDTEENKPRFDLLKPENQPYKEQFMTRMAELMARGAEKYGDRNWELADSEDEYKRFKRSAARHFAQWEAGEDDEDHAAAVWFNLQAAEYVKWRMKQESESMTLTFTASDADTEYFGNLFNVTYRGRAA